MRFSLVGCLVVCLVLSTQAWSQGDWIKTWVLEDDAYLAGLSAMAIRYDAGTGNPGYHFVYEKIKASDIRDRRLYYRRYQNGAWENEFEISNRVAQPAALSNLDDALSYLPSMVTGDAAGNVHISARVDCTTTPVAGQSSFPSCANAALQLEEIIVDPDRRTYTAMPIDRTHAIEDERGLSQMSMTDQAVHNCWRVEHTGDNREVYCAQRGFNETAWGAPIQMTGGRAGEENHGYLLHPTNRPRRLSFTTYQAGGYADPKAAAIRLEARDPRQPPQWITMSDPLRQGDFTWLAEDARGGLHVVWQEADAHSDLYEIWHGTCQAGTTTACSKLRHWDKGAGAISQPGGNTKNPQVVITPSDDILVAYQQRVEGKWRIRVAYRCHQTPAWQHVTPDDQYDDQELWLGRPAFVQDPRAGEVHVVYRVTHQGRVRARWARRAYPTCAAPSLASLTCSQSDKPDLSAQGVNAVSGPMADLPLVKRTLTGPEATCNDGSPAVMYIRPGLDRGGKTAVSNQWIIHLQGGSNCTDADACRDRWCSEGTQKSYSAGKMSTTGLPPAILSQGIFSTDQTNPFRHFNHVFVYYCSSDNWVGAAGPQTHSSKNQAYSLEFRGAAIVADVIRTLKTDAGTWSDAWEGGDPVWIPDIDRATQVLLTGSSAGSIGVRHHVDRLHRQLRQDNPKMAVRAVVDVGFLPFLGHEAINWQHAASPESYDAWLTQQWETMQSFWQATQATLDQSCLQHAQRQDRKWCSDAVYVLKHHITTPFFVSQDLNDPVLWKWLDAWQLVPDTLTLAHIVREQLYDLGVAGAEPRSFAPGVFAPHCGIHELLSNRHFFDVAVGTETLYSTLDHWLNQQDPVVVIQADAEAGSPSARADGCP